MHSFTVGVSRYDSTVLVAHPLIIDAIASPKNILFFIDPPLNLGNVSAAIVAVKSCHSNRKNYCRPGRIQFPTIPASTGIQRQKCLKIVDHLNATPHGFNYRLSFERANHARFCFAGSGRWRTQLRGCPPCRPRADDSSFMPLR